MGARWFLIAAVLGTVPCVADPLTVHDPPWNPQHIDQLPPDIRRAVLAKCASRPDAGHYFATYLHDEVHLHFEHFHCEGVSFCDSSGCLHQIYGSSGGHYHLLRTFHAPGND